MPDWLQPITVVNPLRYFLVIVKGIFLKDIPLSEVVRQTLPLLAIAIVTLGAASWLFRRRLE
jgi:ABC-2 type transport system permease protein